MLYNLIISLINFVIKAFGSLANLLISILPPSPFQLIDNSPIAEYLGWFNWVVPVGAMLTIMSTWLLAVGTYYLVMVALRWVKMM